MLMDYPMLVFMTTAGMPGMRHAYMYIWALIKRSTLMHYVNLLEYICSLLNSKLFQFWKPLLIYLSVTWNLKLYIQSNQTLHVKISNFTIHALLVNLLIQRLLLLTCLNVYQGMDNYM